MSDAIVRLRLDAGNYAQTLKSATRELQNTVQQVREMGATFAVTDKEETNFAQSFARLATSASSTKQQLREITAAINDLKTAYAAMTGEERNSPFGQGIKDSIDQLIERAGILRDTMADTTQAINNAASDTRGFDQLIGVANVMAGSYGVLSAGAELFGMSTLSNSEAMRKLQTAIALCSSAQTLQNALQKQGAVYQGVLAVQARARAQAEALATSSTKAATVAQKAFNLVATANPYALLATAIAAVGTALVAFTSKATEATSIGKTLAGTINSVGGNTVDSQAKLDAYRSTLETATQGTVQYQEAERGLLEMAKTFNVSVETKNGHIIDLTKAYNDLTDAIWNAAVQEAKFEANKAAVAKLIKLKQQEAILIENIQTSKELEEANGNIYTSSVTGISLSNVQAGQTRNLQQQLKGNRRQQKMTEENLEKTNKTLEGLYRNTYAYAPDNGSVTPKRHRAGGGRTAAATVKKPLTAEEKAELWREANDVMQKDTHGLFNSSIKVANAAYNENVNRLSSNGAEYYAFRKLNELTPTEPTPFIFQDNQGYKQSDEFGNLKFTESITKLRSGLDKVSDGVSAGSSLLTNISGIITTLGGNSAALKSLTTVLGIVSSVIQIATTAIEIGAIAGLVPLSKRFDGNAGGLQGLIADGAIGGGQTLTATIKGEDIYLSNRNYKRRTGK